MICLVLLFPHIVSAKNLYVAKTGNDSVTYAANDISHPWLTFAKALANAVAGDTVWLRGGTYNESPELMTTNSGTGNSDSQRIIYKAYPGETPVIVSTTTHGAALFIDDDYITIDGLTFYTTINNASNGDRSCIDVGDWHSATHVKIINCHLKIVYSATHDNVDCIILEGGHNSDYALIQNNDLEGYTTTQCGGVIIMTVGSATGAKILNNEIHNLGIGLYCKHVNGDTSFSSGAEWAYNYIHDIGPTNDGGVMGIPAYINIHDNIIVNANGTDFGINGGGSNGTNSLINHNTFYGGKFRAQNESGGMINYTIKNNIMNSYEVYGGSGNTWDYNIYKSGSAIGAHDLANTSPSFSGGSTPTTIAGFTLTSGSRGYAAASDGKNMGADTTLVGIQTGGSVTPPVDSTPPVVPQGVTVNIIQ